MTFLRGRCPRVNNVPLAAPQMGLGQENDIGGVDVVDGPDRLEAREAPVFGPPFQVGGASSSGNGQAPPPMSAAREPVGDPLGGVAPDGPGPDIARAEIERSIPWVGERGKADMIHGEYQKPVLGALR
eukprot:14507875-Alexandrium_andersonii.AAC.1